MLRKYASAFVVALIILTSIQFTSSQGANASPFMDGFPDWAQDAMGGGD